jgi:hypothetical protein
MLAAHPSVQPAEQWKMASKGFEEGDMIKHLALRADKSKKSGAVDLVPGTVKKR